MGTDPEKKVELDLVLGSNQGMKVRKKDSEGMVTVGADHSAMVVVNIAQYHE